MQQGAVTVFRNGHVYERFLSWGMREEGKVFVREQMWKREHDQAVKEVIDESSS